MELIEQIIPYNRMGLLAEALTNHEEFTTYFYNNRGLILLEMHHHLSDPEGKLDKQYKFEYVYKR